MYEHLIEKFIRTYGGSEDDIRIFESPGRVNLIGEHIDYNGGYVLPAALSMKTTVLARKRHDKFIRMLATDLDYVIQAEMDRLEYFKDYKWGNYQLGVAWQMQQFGYKLSGCEMIFEDKVPLGSGLSSSAAIEVATAIALTALNDLEIPMTELAIIGQKAEHNYVGVNCGIMDQFASAMGKKDNAIMLDCKTLEYRYIPLQSKEYKIVIGNTRKKRSLGESAYNQRRNECEQALMDIRTVIPGIEWLCDLTPKQLDKNINVIRDETCRKRAVHVVYENNRVLKSADVLTSGDLDEFGKLMIESHESLRDLYEVSCRELDIMVEAALEQKGVLGSRMTGAGFGGCTVSFVKESEIESFMKNVGKIYTEKTGITPEFYVSEISNGGREIT
ncbi:MAG: galactokinase [Clostridia bacterium]|nr:galactokinase [Clostridia bacterium]MBN2882237.1 galactokinase [Clostridia bacterium]